MTFKEMESRFPRATKLARACIYASNDEDYEPSDADVEHLDDEEDCKVPEIILGKLDELTFRSLVDPENDVDEEIDDLLLSNDEKEILEQFASEF